MLLVSHASSICTSEAFSSHQKKFTNSLSTEKGDPAPVMGIDGGSKLSFAPCMSHVMKDSYGLFSIYICGSNPLFLVISLLLMELLFFNQPPEFLFFLNPPPELLIRCMHGRLLLLFTEHV